MAYKTVDKKINNVVLLKKNKSIKVIKKEFKPDTLLDKMLLEIIEKSRELKQLKDKFNDKDIPLNILIHIKSLEMFLFSMSNLMVA